MDSERHIHRCGKAEPHSGLRLGRFRLKKWHQRNRTKLDRAKAPHQQARGMRQRLRAALDKFGVVRQIFRQGYLRHRSLMMEALLNPLKRSHQIEKRLVVLSRDDAPVRTEEHTAELHSQILNSYAVF